MDYKRLLKKYIEYIKTCEDNDFINIVDQRDYSDIEFTEDEWEELEELAN